ncbi:MAG: carboxy-S-adenosyl-L-methionine synthase CmoA [Oceanobacter sp.]
MTQPDDLYQSLATGGSDFRFDDAVARVFPDMIRRSVPGYAETVAMSGIITRRYVQPDTHVYDLGCSLGAVTLAMRHGLSEAGDRSHGCSLVGVDNSQSMLERASHYVALDESGSEQVPFPVELVCADICEFEFQPSSVVALNYVLQFISPEQRLALLTKIADSLLPGGTLILSEKLCFDEQEQGVQDELHLDFKRANGYSDLEISRKRSAIENVLIPETEQTHRQRLLDAGFSQVVRWYQCFNFVSFLAIR